MDLWKLTGITFHKIKKPELYWPSAPHRFNLIGFSLPSALALLLFFFFFLNVGSRNLLSFHDYGNSGMLMKMQLHWQFMLWVWNFSLLKVYRSAMCFWQDYTFILTLLLSMGREKEIGRISTSYDKWAWFDKLASEVGQLRRRRVLLPLLQSITSGAGVDWVLERGGISTLMVRFATGALSEPSTCDLCILSCLSL